MASLHRETVLAAPAEAVWAALREAGAVHRLFPGVLAAARLEGEIRVVAFADGQEVRERILGLDETRRRIAYAVLREGLHHAAAMRVVPDGPDRCRFLWTTDVRPDATAARIGALMDAGIAALHRWAAGRCATSGDAGTSRPVATVPETNDAPRRPAAAARPARRLRRSAAHE